MRLEDMGVIGNCQFSAHIARNGSVVWCCLPRFDAEPVFASLLDKKDGGLFSVAPAGGELGTQRYVANTNVLETLFETREGSFTVKDFAPRFELNERAFRPTQLIRIVEPVAGTPRIRVRCEPILGWSKRQPARIVGSNHIAFEGFPSHLRLTTDIPLSYVDGPAFALTGRHHLALAWGAPVEESLFDVCERFYRGTTRYWERWVKQCSIPPLYQEEVIRSALALKLHCFEDTGAIIAALTTSLPEAEGSARTWDYRYCWLRDAYYALSALRLIGHFEERERFANYLINVVSNHPKMDLAPLYRIDGSTDLTEHVLDAWLGYHGEKPVRIGNAAALHQQNDIFGEMVLALAPVYLDDRFSGERSRHTLELMRRLARRAIDVAGTPDAGIWEYRGDWKPQTFSSLMCWAAADRMALVADRHCRGETSEFRNAADGIRSQILANGWSNGASSFVAHYGSEDMDAALLQAVSLRLLPKGDVRLEQTVRAIQKDLLRGGWLLRYRRDGMGKSSVAFTICTFWLVEALARIGQIDEARAIFEAARSALSPLGLLSEDYEPSARRMWGNFPQAYSHVGLIHAAFAASPSWSEML